jgi:hypothetical protein
MIGLDVVEVGWWASVFVLVLAGLAGAWAAARLVRSLALWGGRLIRRHHSKGSTSSAAHL